MVRERVHVAPIPTSPQPRETRVPDAECPTVLLFGSLRANKGIDDFLRALPLLTEPSLRVVVAGGGEREIESRLRAHQAMDPRLELELGQVDDHRKWELFESASCVVLPYTSFHSQSGVLADAYSASRPLVVTDVGAIGPTVRDDQTGEVVPPSDPAALAAAIDKVLRAGVPAYADRLAAAVVRHEPRAVGAVLREVYETAARGRSTS
ncbi:MAG TPA: hypothetical protein DCR14_14885 [Acidimicrobiaceae bacterium]|nr:hypothetical protein [Acidimicrobiaceae bacterium]